MTTLLSPLVAIGLLFSAPAFVGAQSASPRRSASPARPTPAPAVAPSRALLDAHCVTCHNDRLKTAGLSLTDVDLNKPARHAAVLETVVRKLRSGQMPPLGSPRPEPAVMTSFVTALEASLDRAAAAHPDPGHVASRRLNRVEYVNAVRDLLALEINGADLLPSDLANYGFDNNADVLAITPALMARYMFAATKISRLALASPDNRAMTQEYQVALAGHGARQDARMNEDMPFATHGGLAVRHAFPLDGEYTFKMTLRRNRVTDALIGLDEDEHEIELRIDHALVKRFQVGGKLKGPDPGSLVAPADDDIVGKQIHEYRMTADSTLELRVPVKAGTRLVAVGFTDSRPSALVYSAFGRSRDDDRVGLSTLQISGPFGGKTPQDTPSRRQIFACRPAGSRDEEPCARRILTTLTRRAYRRPVDERDLQPLLEIYRAGRRERDFDFGIERALEAMLAAPSFLIRSEREPADTRPGTPYHISDVELASRVSFFLWRSIPDDELFTVAAAGKLREPAMLLRQVKRMLADRRSSRFLADFVQQWLQVRNLQAHEPDPRRFAGFDQTLRDAMGRETELFFESQVRDDRPVQDLLRANYTFLNERLARHYGITGIYGSHFRRVPLTDARRFGLLGHGSVLTVTSYADRTSVVLRGKWVLENLLGAPPPPPPPNVPPLKENTPGEKPAALRERMEQHRRNPVCATCHSRMDPLGFALEHFDAIGQWRDRDAEAPINATITLSGKTIENPQAFRDALLVEGGDEFVRTVIEKVLTYALGRRVAPTEGPVIRQLVRQVAQDGYRWSSLVQGIITSAPFQMRMARPDEGAPTQIARAR